MPGTGPSDDRTDGPQGRPSDSLEHDSSLSEHEKVEVSERAKLRPIAVYEIVRGEGVEELARPTSSLVWSGLAAGISIGFSVYAQATLRHHLPDLAWRPLLECWGYSVGFLIVIIARQQLFTEITLSAVLPLLERPDKKGMRGIARLWFLVLTANLFGTAIFAGGIAVDLLNMSEIRRAAIAIAGEALSHGPITVFFRAIAAGWLIATVVWLLPSAQGAGFIVIALLTYLIALFELSHIIAGSVELFLLLFTQQISVSAGFFGFFMPALVGNVIGGSALFALISYAQIAEELHQGSAEPAREQVD